MHPAASRRGSPKAHPLSDRRLISRKRLPTRALRRSFSRIARNQRASHSRSLGLTNLARRAQPARNPADASARGFTDNHRLSSRSTSGFGLGPGEYATNCPAAASRWRNWSSSSANSRHLGHCGSSAAGTNLRERQPTPSWPVCRARVVRRNLHVRRRERRALQDRRSHVDW